ncbi:MAG: hypothetical protein Q7S55_04570 [Nanoarchaeota archaeon]|nr:hypothetical protein [Nanoarchaeota archaeon]
MAKNQDKRITVRFNAREQAELELLKKTFHLEGDSEAVKMAVEWCNSYLKNVTNTFFPPSFEVVLVRKRKTESIDRKVYDG